MKISKKAIIAALSKRKTWAGIFIALGFAGISVSPTLQDAITDTGVTIVTAVQGG